MKTNILTAMFLTIALCGCREEFMLYDDYQARLNFDLSRMDAENRTVEHFTFVFTNTEVRQDTMWIGVKTMGYTSDEDRPFSLEQMDANEVDTDFEGTALNAIPGVHYIAFDHPSLRGYYRIPAGQAYVRIPVVFLRDASLTQEERMLFFRIREDGIWQQGIPEYRIRRTGVSDKLTEPVRWQNIAFYFGEYGPVKHRFLIDITGQKWDDEFINSFYSFFTGDRTYLEYLLHLARTKLKEENTRRLAEKLDILKEADGTPVTFE